MPSPPVEDENIGKSSRWSVKPCFDFSISSNRFVVKQSFQFSLGHPVAVVVAREAKEAKAAKGLRAKEGRAGAAVEKGARAERE
jgi:hypothetical protein